MRILLIAPPIMDDIDGRLQVVGVDAIRECPPLGINTLAAALEDQGHDVVIADLILHGTRSLKAFENDLDAAELVGIGSTSMAWPTAVDVIHQVRQRRPEVPIVCGGIHPTLFDRYILNKFPVQFIVRGEGEVALGRRCDALTGKITVSEVLNLSWMNSGELVRNRIDTKLRTRRIHVRRLRFLPEPLSL
jgi:anaerobic magnesium-protoporphyrin IX monomethyl ester cyclase